jgi:hypothetical protein
MESRAGDAVAVALGVVDQRVANREQVLAGVVEGLYQRRLGLDDALEQLVVEAVFEHRWWRRLVDEFVRPGGRPPRLVDDEKLLLYPERAHPAETVGVAALHRTAVVFRRAKVFCSGLCGRRATARETAMLSLCRLLVVHPPNPGFDEGV